MLGYRSNDAVLTICQNNSAKSIEIIGANEAAEKLLGYAPGSLSGALEAIMPSRMNTLMHEYVEYEDDANDIGMVLSKVQTFSLLGGDKKEKKFRLKVVRGESTRDKLTFRLVLQDTTDMRKDDALRNLIQENFKGHEVLDKELGIPNRQSLEKDVEVAIYYHHKTELRASFVVIQPDYAHALEEQYGKEQRIAIMKHIIKLCRDNLRPTDVVGAMHPTQLAVLLLDSVSDSTRMVANRLRWQIAAHPFILPDNSPLSLSASMIYVNVDGTRTPAELLAACDDAVAALPEDSASNLSQVG